MKFSTPLVEPHAPSSSAGTSFAAKRSLTREYELSPIQPTMDPHDDEDVDSDDDRYGAIY